MAQKTDAELTTEANVIGDEVTASANTADRVRDMLVDVIDSKPNNSRTVNGHALSADVTVTKTDISLGNVDNTSDANKPVSTAQQTALDLKATIAPRIQSVVSSATVTPASATDDMVVITAQAAALALANPTGSPSQGQALIIRIKDNGTARAISYDTLYRAIGVTAPTTTVISKTTYIAMVYNSTDTKWDIIGTRTEA